MTLAQDIIALIATEAYRIAGRDSTTQRATVRMLLRDYGYDGEKLESMTAHVLDHIEFEIA